MPDCGKLVLANEGGGVLLTDIAGLGDGLPALPVFRIVMVASRRSNCFAAKRYSHASSRLTDSITPLPNGPEFAGRGIWPKESLGQTFWTSFCPDLLDSSWGVCKKLCDFCNGIKRVD